jgi:hypothetical protein
MVRFPEIKVLLLLHWLRKKCTEGQLAVGRQLLGSMAGYLEDETMKKALDRVLDGDPIGATDLMFGGPDQ